ncbi:MULTISPECIES: helix-turn-helix domain-containing protein [Clostridia]|uniref:helix-turn-helix domain-containing protein n=1 Tax=Clostridia TaxID=186801 RepID=UPI001FAA5F12|nr:MULTISPECIES: helix-turn-helix domain-containing protein [Clostridia]
MVLEVEESEVMKEDKMLYTVKEAASVFGVNVHTIYELIKKGLLPAMKLGSLKIRKQTLESFLEKYEGMDLSDLNNISELNNIE